MDHSSTEMEKKITYFTVLTSSSRDVARSFLETHQWDLYVAASTFNENQVTVTTTAAEANVQNPSDENLLRRGRNPFSKLRISIPASSLFPSNDSPSQLPLQAPSLSQPPRAQNSQSLKRDSDSPCESQTIKRRQVAGNIRTLADLSGGSEKDSDEAQENKDGEDNRPEQSSRSVSRETDSEELQEQEQDQTHDVVTFIVTIWRNGFTIDDGPLKSFDDPENEAFLETIQRLKSPRELHIVNVIKLIKREEENFNESSAFHGVGRTLAGSASVSSEPPLTTTPPPSTALLVVDPAQPTTSIQLRLADGTRLVTLFNTHHTIRDVRGFIDASRPDGSTDYQLLLMGFPPKPLPDLDQTIEKAGIVNSVLVQKF